LINTNTGEEVLPCFWSANYFTLAPHESIEVSVSCPAGKITGAPISLQVKGWNVKKELVQL
jgi:hypothetical protein